ncbi:MAG: sulfatase-like hydrolase/transferase, partial [Oscillospiraceae bacterium]
MNGYKKETNPLLKQEKIINFPNMYSCGTSTAHSIPCMFSIFGKDNYSYKKGISTENVLDVLKDTQDIAVLWRDNNSDSKGVALRVDYEDFKTPATNTICNEEDCRDEGMLVGLENYIEKNKKDYRYAEAPHPINALDCRTKDNISVARCKEEAEKAQQ